MKRKLQATLIALLCVLSLSAAAKEPTEEEMSKAKTLYDEAIMLVVSKEYEKALVLFEQSYRLSKDPGTLKGIASCHRYAGRPEEAIKYFRLYLELQPDSKQREEIEKRIRLIEEKMKDAKAVAATQPVAVQPASTQPVSNPTSVAVLNQEAFTLYATQEISAAFDELEGLIQTSEEELARVKKRMRFVLPAGVAMGGGVLGMGALLVSFNIEANNRVNNQIQAQQAALALSADLAFVAAGYLLYRAISKNRKEAPFVVSVAPVSSGGALSLSYPFPPYGVGSPSR